MRTLVIDTATKACSVALFDGDQLLSARHEVIGRGHAERLLPLISDLPDHGQADQIMVNVGPGSFTGIRVGVAAARALGLAWRIDVSGYGCLSMIAAMGQAQMAKPEAIDVVMTGGHGEYFFEAFCDQGQSLAPARSVLPETVNALAMAKHVAGDIDLQRADRIWFDMLPNAGQWLSLPKGNPLPPTPIYGRAPDAKPVAIRK